MFKRIAAWARRKILIATGFVAVYRVGFNPGFEKLSKREIGVKVIFVDKSEILKKSSLRGKVLVVGDPMFRLPTIWHAHSRFKSLGKMLTFLDGKYIKLSPHSQTLVHILEQSNIEHYIELDNSIAFKASGLVALKSKAVPRSLTSATNSNSINQGGYISAKSATEDVITVTKAPEIIMAAQSYTPITLREICSDKFQDLEFETGLNMGSLMAKESADGEVPFFINLLRLGYLVREKPSE